MKHTFIDQSSPDRPLHRLEHFATEYEVKFQDQWVWPTKDIFELRDKPRRMESKELALALAELSNATELIEIRYRYINA